MPLNLQDDQEDIPLSQLEKNLIAFKGIFNILNSTSFNSKLADEKLSKGFNVFNEDILVDPINKAFTSAQLGFFRTRTWSVNEGRPSLEPTISSGQEDNNGSSNPNVEKVIIFYSDGKFKIYNN